MTEIGSCLLHLQVRSEIRCDRMVGTLLDRIGLRAGDVRGSRGLATTGSSNMSILLQSAGHKDRLPVLQDPTLRAPDMMMMQ